MNQWTCVALVQPQTPKSCPILYNPMDCSTPSFPVLLSPCTSSYPLNQWCLQCFNGSLMPSNISFPIALFSFCLQSFPASESFPMSWFFPSGSQSIRASAWVSVLPMNIQAWYPLRLIGMISLLSKRLSRVFSITTVWKHQLFGPQLPLWSNFHICIWLLEKS